MKGKNWSQVFIGTQSTHTHDVTEQNTNKNWRVISIPYKKPRFQAITSSKMEQNDHEPCIEEFSNWIYVG